MTETIKLSQREADLYWVGPSSSERCGNCRFFRANSCEIVSDFVDSNSCCDKWQEHDSALEFVLGQRHVRTPRGEYFFHEPIGTPITEAEYQQLLAQRLAAKKAHEVGHPVRLGAERAVRSARRMRSGPDIDTPDVDTPGQQDVDNELQEVQKDADNVLKGVQAEAQAEGQRRANAKVESARARLAQLKVERGTGRTANVATSEADKRLTQGQTPSSFAHPDTGRMMSKSEIGDTYEQLFQTHGAHLLEHAFGGDYQMISHAHGGARNTPLDFRLDKTFGGELKTMSANKKTKLKTAIKKEEIDRKHAAIAKEGLKPLLVVQVVDQQSGTVNVYAHDAFASKNVSTMRHIGTYRYTHNDFHDAQKAAGYRREMRPSPSAPPVNPAARLTSDAEYQKLLDARKIAQEKYPVGHPERVAAERAVRQARKQIHGKEPTPRTPRTPVPRTPYVSQRTPRTPVPSGTKIAARIVHTYSWSPDPEVDKAFQAQAEVAIRQQLTHQAKFVPQILNKNTSIEIQITEDPMSDKSRASGSYTGTSNWGLLRIRPDNFPHLAISNGEWKEAPFRKLGSEPHDVMRRTTGSWWIPTNPGVSLSDYILAHEIGHGVNQAAFDRPGNDVGIPNDDQFWKMFAKLLGAMAPDPEIHYKPKYGARPGEPSVTEEKVHTYASISRWAKLPSVRSRIETQISKYAAGGNQKDATPRELFSELWAEHTLNSNPRPLANFYSNYAKRILAERDQEEIRQQELLRRIPTDVKQFNPEKLVIGETIRFASPAMEIKRLSASRWEVTKFNDNGSFMGAWGRGSPEAVKMLIENEWLRQNGATDRAISGRSVPDATSAPVSASIPGPADRYKDSAGNQYFMQDRQWHRINPNGTATSVKSVPTILIPVIPERVNATPRIKPTGPPPAHLYHSTRAKLSPGAIIAPGRQSNFPQTVKGWSYATPSPFEASDFGSRAPGRGEVHHYQVVPVGTYSKDPGSSGVRSREGFRIVREIPNAEMSKLPRAAWNPTPYPGYQGRDPEYELDLRIFELNMLLNENPDDPPVQRELAELLAERERVRAKLRLVRK